MPMNSNYMPGDANKKLYNAGSVWQDELGGVIDYYSTFFREYDPVIGRFNGVDPQADATVWLSIYHYADNNPINFNDPMGDISSGDYSSEWTAILSKFSGSNARYGGHWSPTTGADFFQSNAEATALGFLAAGGASLNIFYGAFNYGNVDLKELYTKRYQQIVSGKRDFKFSSSKNSNFLKDLGIIATVKVGAAVLALLDVISTQSKIFINIGSLSILVAGKIKSEGGETTPDIKMASDGTRSLVAIGISYWQGELDLEGVKTPSYVILAHELWHGLDFLTGGVINNFSNYVFPYDVSKYPTQSEIALSRLSPARMYSEFRAVDFENAIRQGVNPNAPLRYTYVINIFKWLGVLTKWSFK